MRTAPETSVMVSGRGSAAFASVADSMMALNATPAMRSVCFVFISPSPQRYGSSLMRTMVTFASVAPGSRNIALTRSGYADSGSVCVAQRVSLQIVPGMQAPSSRMYEIVAVPLLLSVISMRNRCSGVYVPTAR